MLFHILLMFLASYIPTQTTARYRTKYMTMSGARIISTGVSSLLSNLKFDNKNTKNLPVEKDNNNYSVSRQTPNVIFAPAVPTPVTSPRLIAYSTDALELLGLHVPVDQSAQTAFVTEMETYFSGNKLLPGSNPVAHCYCGPQFGNFAGQLGDGAAISLGEIVNARGERWELQLKGAGLTPYSRTADGRKVLRSSVREFLCSEAMYFLHVPTTRSASCITSSSTVQRDPFYDGGVIDEKCTVKPRFIACPYVLTSPLSSAPVYDILSYLISGLTISNPYFLSDLVHLVLIGNHPHCTKFLSVRII